MNCEEVQARLLEYLEKLLDHEIHGAVESHLSSCSRCQGEAESLAEGIRSVADLPSVEPPLGFSQKVMAHIREEAERPRLWHRLFMPIGVKIPIHATALLLVGGFAVYIYQTSQPPEMQLAKSQRAKTETTVRTDLLLEEKDVQSFMSPAPPFALSDQRAKVADEVGESLKRSEKAGREELGSLRYRRRQAVPSKEPTATLAHPSRAPSVRTADYEFVLTPRKTSKDIRVLREQLIDLVKQVQGEYVQTKRRAKKLEQDLPLEPQTIWINLSEDKFDQFKTELAALGKIELVSRALSSEDRPALKLRSQLRIKITILSPKE